MQTIHATLFFVLYWCLVLLMIVLVANLLISLTKKGDERKTHIKTMAMANTFLILVGVLFLNVLWTMYRMIMGQAGSPYPFVYLFAVSLIFLISLIFNKRKYGDW